MLRDAEPDGSRCQENSKHGRYWLIDPRIDGLALGGEWGVELDDVEAWLCSYVRK